MGDDLADDGKRANIFVLRLHHPEIAQYWEHICPLLLVYQHLPDPDGPVWIVRLDNLDDQYGSFSDADHAVVQAKARKLR